MQHVKEYQTRLYQPSDFDLWNAFISEAKNATFLFHRNFMDYHKDRFEDHSLLVFSGQELMAVLPANRTGNTVYSHQGLTYGGLVLSEKLRLGEVIKITRSVLSFLENCQVKTLIVKLLPELYPRFFSQETDYCLFLLKAETLRKDCLSVIDLTQDFSFTKSRKDCIKKSLAAGLSVREETNFELFWTQILIPNLQQKHQSGPVHTWQEMAMLQAYFPENIRHFNVYHEGEIVAGATLFVTEKLVHAQYISGNKKNNALNSLDYLFHHLITHVFAGKNYFDFGSSHEQNGQKINNGLLFWKESFGARTALQSTYSVSVGNGHLLENVLL